MGEPVNAFVAVNFLTDVVHAVVDRWTRYSTERLGASLSGLSGRFTAATVRLSR